jgi:hypothetical protein
MGAIVRRARTGSAGSWHDRDGRCEAGRDSRLELAGAESVDRQSQPDVSGRAMADRGSARTGVMRTRVGDFEARSGTQQPQVAERFFAQHLETAAEAVPESQAVTSVAGKTNPAKARTSSK